MSFKACTSHVMANIFAEVPTDCTTAAKFGSRFFTLVDQPRVYSEAEAICALMGGHLASIHSKAEDDFLKAYIEQK